MSATRSGRHRCHVAPRRRWISRCSAADDAIEAAQHERSAEGEEPDDHDDDEHDVGVSPLWLSGSRGEHGAELSAQRDRAAWGPRPAGPPPCCSSSRTKPSERLVPRDGATLSRSGGDVGVLVPGTRTGRLARADRREERHRLERATRTGKGDVYEPAGRCRSGARRLTAGASWRGGAPGHLRRLSAALVRRRRVATTSSSMTSPTTSRSYRGLDVVAALIVNGAAGAGEDKFDAVNETSVVIVVDAIR